MNENETQNLAERPSNDGNPDETILAGAPDGQPWSDESAAGKDMGNAAAIAGYKDDGSPGATPDVPGFASGASGSEIEPGSTSGNGPGNVSTNIDGAIPGQTQDRNETTGNEQNPGADVLEDDAEADQGGFKGA